MAARDYVLCAHCGVKVFYDGSQKIRDSLEERWGDPSAPDFTVHMICPECLKKQEDDIERLKKQRDLGNAAIREAEELQKENEWLREMLQVCMDKWIPFREVAFRKKIEEALGHE